MKTKAEERAICQARAEVFADLYRAGKTLQEIGDEFGGISRERVRQVIAKQYGSLSGEGGKRARSEIGRARRLADRDARCLSERGCTYAQYVEIRGKPSIAFDRQRQNARKRGIGWNLNLWQWWTIWRESGRWDQRGRREGQYVMCRYGDSGAYEVGNVYIDTTSNNLSDGFQYRGRNKWGGGKKIATAC